MKDTLLAIAGRPGLCRLLKQGRGNLIVETIDADKKRFSVGARDRVTSLNDVSMYSDDGDVALMEVFQNIVDKYKGVVPMSHKTAKESELETFMAEALPTYDRDRVHVSDIRKLLQWYNILATAGYTEFAEKEETPAAESAEAEETK